MNDFAGAFHTAVELIGRFDPGLRSIVTLSLGVSLTASACAFAIGAPLGTALAVYRFRGRGALVVVANALLGLPPVVVGLADYLLLSRSGPLGSLGILFTPTAMVIAQCALGTPIVIALVHRASVGLWAAYGDALQVDGASRLRAIPTLMLMGPDGLLTAFLAAFGRAIAIGRCHHCYRWWEHSRLHANYDDSNRAGDEQRRPQFRAGARDDLDRLVDAGKRRQFFGGAQSDES